MKRLSLFGFVGVLAGVLGGCPLYNEDDPGRVPIDTCDEPGCETPPPGCKSPSDCGINETCGSDGKCHIGDCTIWGCVKGFECTLNEDMTTTCKEPVSSTSTSGGQGGGSSSSSSSSGAGGEGGSPQVPPVYCGNPRDCGFGENCNPDGICEKGDCAIVGCIHGYACSGDGACKSSNPAACSEDPQCLGFGAGYLCVSGICTVPSDQCSDQTQCPPNNKCADGKCTPACASDAECPAGFGCNTNTGVCSLPSKPCSITNDCGGPALVCVDGACVPRSAKDGTCAQGVWVDNGCIPSQSATFFCAADGMPAGCAMGSICLHHNCYISCEVPNGTACDNLPTFNVCKDVTTVSGPHKVCGSNQNLGGNCNPTQGTVCGSGKACIDGYCK